MILNYYPIRRLNYNQNLTDIIDETSIFALIRPVTNLTIHEQLTMLSKNKEITLHYPDGDTIHMIAEGVDNPNPFSYV